MCFGTLNDANQFYQNYAKRVGFVTKIRFTRRVGRDKVPKNQMITCNREETRKSRVSPIEKTNPKTNYNCPARISIRLNKEGLWVISKVCLDHSHPCNSEMAKLLTCNREMSMHMCEVIKRNDGAEYDYQNQWEDFLIEYGLEDNKWLSECQKHVAKSSSNANELDNLITLEDGGKDALSIFIGGCTISIQDIKIPPYVSTKGCPTNRLGSENDKMIKKKTKAKKRKVR
ncbi:hypothetical protein Ahy_B04g071305 [Arachis hypogaea]|uniref:FAR1 domain-containing protein n=1 Tax=Arachis hypogaea TaxID=3818 RepID=A0A444ZKE0_ARAHY|nr:hypothetical protein Ahy_B04g071305 [Arachis hypogaea]